MRADAYLYLLDSFHQRKGLTLNSGGKLHPLKFDLSPVIWGCFTLLTINALTFIYFTVAPHIQIDVFRHLEEIVLPFLDGRKGFSVLWSNHHPFPLLHVLQIANLKFFGFRLDLDAYLGLFFQVLTTYLILRAIMSTTAFKNQSAGIIGALGTLPIVFIALGFNTLEQYTWPLLAIVQSLYFLAILVFLSVDRCLQAESHFRRFAVAATSLLFMTANADFGTVFLVSLLGVLFLVYCIERKVVYLRTALVISVVWIAYRLFMLAILPEGPPRPANYTVQVLLNLLEHPLQTFTAFSIALSSGLLDIVGIKQRFPGTEWYLVLFALLTTFLFVAVFFTYLRKRLYRVSVTPLALMLYTVVLSLSVFIFRFWGIGPDDIWSLAAMRYAPSFKLGVIGMLWALFLIVGNNVSTRGTPPKLLYRATIALAISFILCIQGIQIYNGWIKVPDIRVDNDNRALAVFLAGKPLENSIELPLKILGNPGDPRHFPGVTAYLEKNKLNVFSDSFPSGPVLGQHIKSRDLFYAADIAVPIRKKNGASGIISDETGGLLATWKMLPRGILIDNQSGQTLFLRVEFSADYSATQYGHFLFADFGNSPPKKIQLYKGKQNLFFSLERGTLFRITTNPHDGIEEFELRN